MKRTPFFWMLCLSLVLTRLLGVHVHSCAGIEGKPHHHEPTHYADSGLVFGENHSADHGDNLESDLAGAIAPAKGTIDFHDDAALPAWDRLTVAGAAGWLTVRAARGPPTTVTRRPTYFAPPLRGPPSYA